MSTTLIIITVAAVVFAAAAWWGWNRWFRDAEVNLLADAMTYVGLLAEILGYLDDPAINELLSAAGINPVWLIVIGIVFRLARRLRDQSMAVTEPSVTAPKGDAAEAAEEEVAATETTTTP